MIDGKPFLRIPSVRMSPPHPAFQGCTCFSDKTDVWSGMNARLRAARAARVAAIRKRNREMYGSRQLVALFALFIDGDIRRGGGEGSIVRKDAIFLS